MSRTFASLTALIGVLLFAGAAVAQSPRRGVYVPPDVKGFAAQQLYLRSAPAPSHPSAVRMSRGGTTSSVAVAAAPMPLIQVAITIPQTPSPDAVAIRGPDGEVRRFEVEGGRATLQNRVIVVRPGERATVTFVVRR